LPALADQRHEAFAVQRASGKNRAQAYKDAGFKDTPAARINAQRLLKRPEVAARIAEIADYINTKALEGVVLSAEQVLRWMMSTRHAAFAADQYAVAVRAEELLGRQFGLFVEQHEHGKPGDFAALSDAELSELVREGARDAGIRKKRRKPAMIEGKARDVTGDTSATIADIGKSNDKA